MSLIIWLIGSALVALLIYKLACKSKSQPVLIGGAVDPRFENVKDVFRRNFADGLEKQGAAFAVYQNGQLVVDLWGGYADKAANRQWRQDTMSIAFSASKGICSLCIAKLVSDGKLSYDDLVMKHWPEFGQNGKENVTVAMLVSHEAGLAGLDRPVTLEDVTDSKRMSKLLEDQAPNWPPGTGRGYHALTHGFLLSQLIERVDTKHRTLAKYFAEEIKGNEDFYIGTPKEELLRVARLDSESAGLCGLVQECLYDTELGKTVVQMMYESITQPNALISKVMASTVFLAVQDGRQPFNNPEMQQLEIPAANGVCTARGLAQPFNKLLTGQLVDQKTLAIIRKPRRVLEKDLIIGLRLTTGYGFQHNLSPAGTMLFGNPGVGGQNVKVDFEKGIVYAYITNDMKSMACETSKTLHRLLSALYEKL